MMQEIMDQEERVMLDQIAKLTEENHVEWACDEYNPIGFLDKDDDSEQSACICQMFQFSAVLNGFHYELELAEYINVPSGKIDLSVTLTRNDDEHFLKIDSILSVELATSQEKEAKDIDNIAAVRLAKRLVPLAVKTDAVAEAFSWASFINQTGISKALLNNNLTKLGEKLCSEGGFASLCYAIPLIQHHRNLINKLFRCRPVALEGHHVPDRLCISIMMIESFINRSLHLL